METTAATTNRRAPRPAATSLRRLLDLRLLLVALLSLLCTTLAYQAPPSGQVAIGWLGDRLFLRADAGQRDSDAFHADDLTPDSPTGRSRWTRRVARVTLPGIGAGAPLELTLLAQGWPTDLVGRQQAQPLVTVLAGGQEIGTFKPSGDWATHSFAVPTSARTSEDLTVELVSSDTFTDTLRGADPRPKGVRLAELLVRPAGGDQLFLPPAWPLALQLLLSALLLYLLVLRLSGSGVLAFILTMLAVGALGGALAVGRVWTAALLGSGIGENGVPRLLTPLTLVLGLALATAWRGPLLSGLRGLLLRYSQGQALGYGLVSASLGWLGCLLASWSLRWQMPGLGLFRQMFPDSLLYGMLGMGLLALALVRGREGLPRLADGAAAFLAGRRAAPTLLLILGGIWLGYEALVVRDLAYVGHADYADNAVVARNLLAGRGWVVDYVTQFYKAYGSLTRPQDTWPLLQPVWIAASFALFGQQPWAAKLPNLLCNLLLLLLIYNIGARLWDRRVGLTAALLMLTNWAAFNLTIYSTSDLAFVLFSLGAIYALYRGTPGTRGRAPSSEQRAAYFKPEAFLALSGVLTGLMMLQKPSSAVIALGMGLWMLLEAGFHMEDWRSIPSLRYLKSNIGRFALWGLPALLLLSPYFARNLTLFSRPVYSTEQYDAWVLGYRGERAWEDIYRVYSPELSAAAPGLPDRSWVLRWGFDQSLDKLGLQVRAVRNYLLPPWRGAPSWLAPVTGDDARNPPYSQLFSPLGAWLSLAGGIAALRARRRLMGLLTLAFVPYTLFLVTYWHANEERYFVMLLPWLALLAAWVIWGGYERLAAIGDRRWAPLGLALALAALMGVVGPSWPRIAAKVQDEPQKWAPDLAAYRWIEANTPPDAAMMTRTPWQLNWHTRRSALMVPNTADRELLLSLAHRYGVDYLVLETLNRVKGDAAIALDPLITARTAQPGAIIEGFTLVYASPTPDNRVLIYRLPTAQP